MKNPRVSRRKETIKIKAEINEKETKKTAYEIDHCDWSSDVCSSDLTPSWYLEVQASPRGRRLSQRSIPASQSAIQAYLKKQEKSQINNLTLHLTQLEKEEMKNPRVRKRNEIIKIKAEINEKETKETITKINKTKSWFFEKINKIDKPVARLIKKQR